MSRAKLDGLSEEQFGSMLDQAIASGRAKEGEEKWDVTNDERERIKQAWKKEEFRKLFDEYVDELSDPKNRAEYNAYVKQMEAENKIPDGMQIVLPKPGFCVKVKTQEGEKIFVNVVVSDKVEKPTSERKVDPSTGKEGSQWSLPHHIGPARQEKDKKGSLCWTFDVCFHTELMSYCTLMGQQFKDFAVHSALDGVEARLRDYRRNTKVVPSLSRKYHVLRGTASIGGEPRAMNVPREAAKASKGAGDAGAVPKSFETAFERAKVKERSKEKKAKAAARKKAAADEKGGAVVEPRYVVVHRGRFEMGEFTMSSPAVGGSGAQPQERARPKELVIRIEMPRLRTAKTMTLDVSSTRLEVTGGSIYRLSLRLPYPVADSEGSAKWDKATKTLTVTAPVLPPPTRDTPEQSGNAPQAAAGAQAGDDGADMDDIDEDVEDAAALTRDVGVSRMSSPIRGSGSGAESRKMAGGSSAAVGSPAASPTSAAQRAVSPTRTAARRVKQRGRDHNRWLATPTEEEAKASSSFAAEIAARAAAAEAEARKEAEAAAVAAAAAAAAAVAAEKEAKDETTASTPALGKSRDQEEAQGRAVEERPAVTSSQVEVAAHDGGERKRKPAFVPAASWSGSRDGYVFYKGSQGLGYYRDGPASPKSRSDNVAPDDAGTSVEEAAAVEGWTYMSNADDDDEAVIAANAEWEQDGAARWTAAIAPKFSFQKSAEDEEHVTILVQVADIDARYVRHRVTAKRVEIRFLAKARGIVVSMAVKTSDGDYGGDQRYVLAFDTPTPVVPTRCRFNVASDNMAVVIAKAKSSSSSKSSGRTFPGWDAIETDTAVSVGGETPSTGSAASSDNIATAAVEDSFTNELMWDLD